jgi:hypothetical protein
MNPACEFRPDSRNSCKGRNGITFPAKSIVVNRNDFGIGSAEDGWWNKLVTARQNLVSNEVHVETKLQGVIWNVKRLRSSFAGLFAEAL